MENTVVSGNLYLDWQSPTELEYALKIDNHLYRLKNGDRMIVFSPDLMNGQKRVLWQGNIKIDYKEDFIVVKMAGFSKSFKYMQPIITLDSMHPVNLYACFEHGYHAVVRKAQ